MAFSAKRVELIAEIAELHRLQMGANQKAALGGWTRQSEAWYERREARISVCGRMRFVRRSTRSNANLIRANSCEFTDLQL